MRTINLMMLTILFLPALYGPTPPALAESAAHYSLRLDNATIPWIFPPPEGLTSFCPEVPEGVHINPDDFGSDRLKQVTQTDMADGTMRINVVDLVQGTASDNYGATYTFIYENNTTHSYDGSVVTVAMKDTFELKGENASFVVGFNWRWQYPATSLEVVQVIEDGQLMDIFVSPFNFVTADGVHEDPNIVPGSWQKLSTRGEPAFCDPL